ncbi:REP-associated tyrosine transposase [Stenotrophomonas rhizophila]
MASPRLRYGRQSQPGSTYLLTLVVAGRCRLFLDPGNVALVVESLRYAERNGYSRSTAWVVMPDHVHWLMELRRGSLASCMGLLKSRSARLLNLRLGRQGQLWQHGYHDHALRDDESLVHAARYVMANPIRAGLSSAIGEYPHAWSRWP